MSQKFGKTIISYLLILILGVFIAGCGETVAPLEGTGLDGPLIWGEENFGEKSWTEKP